MTDDRFWLYKWIDEKGIKSEKEASRLARRRRTFAELEQLAGEIPYETLPVDYAGNYVLAGTGMDLSGDLDCHGWECQRKQVDRIFARTWHYFDKIVACGLTPMRFIQMLESATAPETRKVVLESQLRLLLYLRSIGVDEHLIFRQKPPACQVHLEEHLQQTGLEHLVEASLPVIQELAQNGDLKSTELETADQCKDHPYHLKYVFHHPVLEHTQWGTAAYDPNIDQPNLAVARAVFRRYASYMISDIRTSRIVRAPLAAYMGLHRDALSKMSSSLNESSVAFELGLPIISGIPIRELIKIREDEYLAFEKFRRALEVAMTEKISIASTGDSAADIAAELMLDLIVPSLNEIEHRLQKAQEVLAKKSALHIALGAATISVGALAAMPLLLPIGITAALFSATHYAKYLDEKRDIELSDMYFIWRLQGEATESARPERG